jgi:hypothetical protein
VPKQELLFLPEDEESSTQNLVSLHVGFSSIEESSTRGSKTAGTPVYNDADVFVTLYLAKDALKWSTLDHL